MQKIAAIDVGSNAVRLIVASVDGNRNITPIENNRIPIRLGADVFTQKVLKETTILQMVEAFGYFHRLMDAHEVSMIRAVGTSALREAENGQVMVDQIFRTSGIKLEIIDPEEEARLVFLAVADVIDLHDKCSVLVDIGGGSVDIILAENGNILSTRSYELGTVRVLAQANENGQIVSPDVYIARIYDLAEAFRSQLEKELGGNKFDLCVATGGNVEEIGKLRLKMLERQGETLVLADELKEMIERLSQMSYSDRISMLDLRPDRADVIFPAMIVLDLVAGICHVNEIRIPQVGLKMGLLKDLADHLANNLIPPNREQIWEAAVSLGKKYKFDQNHGCFVSRLAGQLFDQTTSLHSLNEEDKWILELGALLHAIGIFINVKDHDRHGFYILNANPIDGLTERQQVMVACLVLFYRDEVPIPDLFDPPLLSAEESSRVVKLCALLRLADVMDVGHAQRITDITLTQNQAIWCLQLNGSGNLWSEKRSIQKQSSLFQKTFGVHLQID